MKTIFLFFFLIISIFLNQSKVIAGNEVVKHCVVGRNNLIDQNLVAISDSFYFQLALDIFSPPGPLLYVMRIKPPYHGKAFFVEFISTSCDDYTLYLRSNDGETKSLTLSTFAETCEPCTPYSHYHTGVISSNGHSDDVNVLERLEFRSVSLMREAGLPAKSFISKNPDINASFLLPIILEATKKLCQIEFGKIKGDDFTNCVVRRSGQTAFDLQLKSSRATP